MRVAGVTSLRGKMTKEELHSSFDYAAAIKFLSTWTGIGKACHGRCGQIYMWCKKRGFEDYAYGMTIEKDGFLCKKCAELRGKNAS